MVKSYTLNVYGLIESTKPASSGTGLQWSEYGATKVGSYNIRIPHFDGDIDTIQYLFSSQLIQYVLGLPTNNFYKLNDALPFGYFNFPRIVYPSPPLSASYVAEQYFICKSINELFDIENLDPSKYYYFAMANDDTDFYLIFRLDRGGVQDTRFLNMEEIRRKSTNTRVVGSLYMAGSSGVFTGGGSSTGGFDYYFIQDYIFSYGENNLYYFAVSGDDYYPNYIRTRWNEHGIVSANDATYLLAALGEPVVIDPTNPYDPIPQPEPDPEIPLVPGAFDFHSDPVPPPSLPNISAAETGFTRLYNPSLSQLNALARYMWTDTSFIQTVINQLKQLLDNPMDYIISLSLVPCAVPNGANISVKLLFIDTGVQMPPVTNQFVEVDCGTYDVVRNYNSALDFAPNTKVSLYLPYIGVVPLDVDEIMPTYPDESTTLGVRYVIDVFGGTCVAMVTVNGSVKYQFSGHCAISIPFNSANFSTYAGALIQAAKTVVGAAAMAAGATGAGATGAGAALLGSALLGAPVQKTSESSQASGKVDDSGNFIDNPKVTMRVSSTKAQFGSLIANNISNTVSQVAASKPVIERSAGFSGNTGYMAVRRPYLLFESPRLVNPTEYGKYNGYPCMMYRSFAELSGFTQVQQIQLVGFSGTNPELDELQALLKSGVIF